MAQRKVLRSGKRTLLPISGVTLSPFFCGSGSRAGITTKSHLDRNIPIADGVEEVAGGEEVDARGVGQGEGDEAVVAHHQGRQQPVEDALQLLTGWGNRAERLDRILRRPEMDGN